MVGGSERVGFYIEEGEGWRRVDVWLCARWGGRSGKVETGNELSHYVKLDFVSLV